VIHYTKGIKLVAEAPLFLKIIGKDALSGVSERSMSQIVSYTYSPCQISIKSKGLADSHRYGGHMHNMLHTGADMVVMRSKEDLGLMLKPPVWIGMDNSGKVTEKIAPDIFLSGIHSFL
jgi:hypothetical protein